MSPERMVGGYDGPDAPRWWSEAEHFIVLHKAIHLTGAVESDDEDPYDHGTLTYEPGEELPAERVTPSMWDGCSDRLAALTAGGERLDTPSGAERSGDIDADAALRTWRRENNLRRRTVQLYECEECGETFEDLDALNGHQSAHAEGEAADGATPAESGGDGEQGVETETLADKLPDEGGEQS
ncbi:MAG: C2H2-type zinc finger protein [Halopenitus sp.]